MSRLRAFIYIFIWALPALLNPTPGLCAEEGAEPLVSMELRGAELSDLMRAVGLAAGMNIIIDEEVRGTATVSLRDVPLWEALDTILRGKGLVYRRLPGGLVMVEPATGPEAEEQGLVVREFRMRYLKVSDSMLSAVEKLLSSRGKAGLLPDANAVVVKDIPVSVDRAERLLARLDRKPRQVLIEARIVEMDASMRKELGINWWAGYEYTSNDVLGGLGSVESTFAVNLPTPSDEGLALGLGLVSDRLTLDVQLSALEDKGDAKIVSNPRVMVMDNQKAVISDGAELLVPEVEATTVIRTGDYIGGPDRTTRAETFAALLELAVTPRVIDGELLSLEIDTRREEFDFNVEVEGFPPKLTRTAKTTLLVHDGETVALGGIIKNEKRKSQSKVPVLGSIPILGRLFRRDITSEEQKELIIFITPKIVEEGAIAPEPPAGHIQDKPGR